MDDTFFGDALLWIIYSTLCIIGLIVSSTRPSFLGDFWGFLSLISCFRETYYYDNHRRYYQIFFFSSRSDKFLSNLRTGYHGRWKSEIYGLRLFWTCEEYMVLCDSFCKLSYFSLGKFS